MGGVEDVEAGDGGRDWREVLRIVEGRDYKDLADPADFEGYEVVAGEGGMHFLQGVEECLLDFGVGGFEHGVVDGDIFREVDEMLTSELLGINEGGHFDDRGEGKAGVSDVGYVVRG